MHLEFPPSLQVRSKSKIYCDFYVRVQPNSRAVGRDLATSHEGLAHVWAAVCRDAWYRTLTPVTSMVDTGTTPRPEQERRCVKRMCR